MLCCCHMVAGCIGAGGCPNAKGCVNAEEDTMAAGAKSIGKDCDDAAMIGG